jgi:hypothetical protein
MDHARHSARIVEDTNWGMRRAVWFTMIREIAHFPPADLIKNTALWRFFCNASNFNSSRTIEAMFVGVGKRWPSALGDFTGPSLIGFNASTRGRHPKKQDDERQCGINKLIAEER